MDQDFEFSLPNDKHDIETAAALVELGWERVEPAAFQILEWVLDGNWPVASVLQPLLVKAGARLAPCVRTILESEDDTGKYHLLVGVVMHSTELALALRPELSRLSCRPTAGELSEEVSNQAQEILKNLHDLSDLPLSTIVY